MKKQNTKNIITTTLILLSLCGTGVIASTDDISTRSRYYPEIIDITTGGLHSIALDRNGDVFVFGSNRYGEIGLGTTSDEGVLYDVSAMESGRAKKVSSRGDHILAIGTDDKVYAWGYNNRGQLGTSDIINRSTMTEVLNLNTAVTDIAAGHQFSLALAEDGSVYSWGHGGYGQLGTGTNETYSLTPVKVDIEDVVQISAGHYHALALKSDGTVWGWGRNLEGALGNDTGVNITSPIQINIENIKEVVAGFNNSFFITNDGEVYACGNNLNGELGDGTQENKTTPVKINGVSGVIQVSSNSCTVFLQSDGIAYGTGSNIVGQLGLGSYTRRVLIPTKIPGEGYTKVSTGGNHTLLYWGTTYSGGLYGGKIYAMGNNQYYQCGQIENENIYYPTEISNIQEIDDRVTWALTGEDALDTDKNIIIASEDTYISQNGDTNTLNYATDKVCGVNYTRRENGNTDWGQYSYFKFDISEIDTTRQLSAKLYVYVDETSDIRNSTRTIGIYGTENNNWVDSELTWNNEIVPDNDNLLGTFEVTGNGSIITDAGWREIDITQYLQKYTGEELSLMAKMISTTPHPVNIRSRDYYTYTAPVLVIDANNNNIIFDATSEFELKGTLDKPCVYSFQVPFDGVYEITNLSFGILNIEILDSSEKIIYDNHSEYKKWAINKNYPNYFFSHFVDLKANQTYYIFSYANIQTQLIPHNKDYRLEQNAKMLHIGSDSIVSFENKDDFLTYKIDIPIDGIYRIQTIGNVNTTGYLYDEDLKLIMKNDDSSKSGAFINKNFRFTIFLSEGTYYLGVENRNKIFNESDNEKFIIKIDFWNDDVLPRSGYEISYYPDSWTGKQVAPGSRVTVFANCYGYAINSQLTYTDPGTLWQQKSGTTEELNYDFYKPGTNEMELYPPEVIGERIINYAKKDAECFGKTFIEVEEEEKCPPGTYKIALLLSLSYPEDSKPFFNDYHWYRQDTNGTWSHKNGQSGVARDWDDSLQKIYIPSPDYADTNYYNYLVGYYAVENCSDLPYVFDTDITNNINDTALTTYSINNELSITDFDFIQENMSRNDIINCIGYPHDQAGSGMLKDIYYLKDNSKIILTYYNLGILYNAVLVDDNGMTKIK